MYCIMYIDFSNNCMYLGNIILMNSSFHCLNSIEIYIIILVDIELYLIDLHGVLQRGVPYRALPCRRMIDALNHKMKVIGTSR